MLRDWKRLQACLLILALGAVLAGGTSAGSFGEGDVTELELSVATPGSVARGRFSGARKERIFVRFSPHSFGLGCQETARVSVVAPDGQTVASKQALCAAGDYLDTFLLPVDGSYELVLDPVGASTGDVTASVLRVPPDLVQHADFLYALGEPFTFDLTDPGQNAGLSVDLLPGVRVLYRFPRNTVAEGCSKPVTAWIEDPDGRVRAKRQLCTGGEAIAFKATADGIYTLVLDPPAARTGRVDVTLFLDQPDVFPTGEFAEETYDINGSRSYGVVVNALYRRGVARVWLRREGAGTIASSSFCQRRCPVKRTLRTTVDARRLDEGRHEFTADAIGPDGRTSGTAAWAILIDRTPPRPPRNFRVETYDPATRTAELGWSEGVDPGGPGGTDSSGSLRSDYRLRRGDGPWSPWRKTDLPFFDVRGVSPGDVFHLRVRGYDGVGNRSRMTESRLRVTGLEPSEPPFERYP